LPQAPTPSRLTSLLDRLRQRKLAQWVVAYLAGAWLVMQVVDVLGDRWMWPLGLQRAIDVLLVVGLAAVLVLAWYHGERGRQRVSGPELLILAMLFAIGGSLIAMSSRPTAELAAAAPAEDGVAAPGEDDGRPAVAVLPFENRSGLEQDIYFTDGVHDEILGRLSGVSALKVISRTSVMSYRGSPKNVRDIAAELGVGAVLEGAVQRAGDQVRIIVQLIDARSDAHLWSQTYDRQLDPENLFRVQSEIATQVANALSAELTPVERARVTHVPTLNLSAYRHYMLGRHFWNRRDQEGMDSAAVHFQAALREDPQYARAHAGLADVHLLGYGPAGDGGLPLALAAARRALAIDPALAEAHTSLAYATMLYEWDWAAAERSFLRAIELDPSYATAHQWYAELLVTLGRTEEAIREVRVAESLDPLSMIISWNVARILAFSRRHEEALAQLDRVAQRYPNAERVLGLRMIELLIVGRLQEVTEIAVEQISPNVPPEMRPRFDEVVAALRRGDPRPLLEEFGRGGAGGEPTPTLRLAMRSAWIGDADAAMETLEAVYHARSFGLNLPEMAVGAAFDPIREDPRFRNLLQRMGLDPAVGLRLAAADPHSP